MKNIFVKPNAAVKLVLSMLKPEKSWISTNFAIALLVALLLFSCHNQVDTPNQQSTKTEYQEQLIRDGWRTHTVPNGEFPSNYGYKPRYGQQDNYFDITMGKGFSLAVKVVNAATDECIRYVFVNENSTTTISQIPQGVYYLKIAYGNDWMEYGADRNVIGKFTRGAFYERSVDLYDFGKKNSSSEVNYLLRINVSHQAGMNNFETVSISEDEFLK